MQVRNLIRLPLLIVLGLALLGAAPKQNANPPSERCFAVLVAAVDAHDIRRMHQALTLRYGWLERNIAVSGQHFLGGYTNEWFPTAVESTTENFVATMERLAKQTRKGDRVLVVIAAHGGIAIGEGFSFEKLDECLSWFRQGVFRIVIIEGCGAARCLTDLAHADIVYAGAGPGETSIGQFLARFDDALIDHEGAAARADQDADGIVTLGEAFDHAIDPDQIRRIDTNRGVPMVRTTTHPERWLRPGLDDHCISLQCDTTGVEDELRPIICNGSFEKVCQGETFPARWTTYEGEHFPCVVADKSMAHSGTSSARVTVGPERPGLGLLHRVDYELDPGRRYRFSCWVRGTPSPGSQGWYAEANIKDVFTVKTGSESARPNQWVRLSTEFTAPSPRGKWRVLALYTYNKNGNTIWYDDVSIEPCSDQDTRRVAPQRETARAEDAALPIIRNGSFEDACHGETFPTCWDTYEGKHFPCVVVDKSMAHTGDSSVRVTVGPDRPGLGLLHRLDNALEPGKRYRFSCWVRGTPAPGFKGWYAEANIKGVFTVKTGSGNAQQDQWVQLSTEFTAPSPRGVWRVLALYTHNKNGNTIWYDDVTIEPL